MIYLTKKVIFSASHRYHNPDFSDEENKKIFGKCNNPHGHGHNYELEVTVKGDLDERTGMFVNLTDLKNLIQREVMEKFDHKNLNEDVEVFESSIPTTENVAMVIWNLLSAKLTTCKLHKIKLVEEPNLFVEYYGES